MSEEISDLSVNPGENFQFIGDKVADPNDQYVTCNLNMSYLMRLIERKQIGSAEAMRLVEGSTCQGDDFMIPGVNMFVKKEVLADLYKQKLVDLPTEEKTIVGVHLFIMRGGRKKTLYLVSERKGKPFGLPGGKRLLDESPEGTLYRELLEEMDINTLDHLHALVGQAKVYRSEAIDEGIRYICIAYAIIDRTDILQNQVDRMWLTPHALRADKYVKRVFDHVMLSGEPGVPIYVKDGLERRPSLEVGISHPAWKKTYIELMCNNRKFNNMDEKFVLSLDVATNLGECYSLKFDGYQVLVFNETSDVIITGQTFDVDGTNNWVMVIPEFCPCGNKVFRSHNWIIITAHSYRVTLGTQSGIKLKDVIRSLINSIMLEFHRKCDTSKLPEGT